MTEGSSYYTDVQIAKMLGFNPVTVRQWRVKNRRLGRVKYGPPYEYRGANVVYPKAAFAEWCASRRVVGGVPMVNLPLSADPAIVVQPPQEDGRLHA